MSNPFVKKTYLSLALDPIYVGTGGYRLGGVDNTIVREPGTNLPKIPGSSISGIARAYTSMVIQSTVDNSKLIKTSNGKTFVDLEEYRKMKYQKPKYKFLSESEIMVDGNNKPVLERNEGKEIYYSCAGKGADGGDGHCGESNCPVCVAFGFSNGKKNISFQGLVQFFDARILFFPVHSMLGPVWVTCPSVLKDFKETLSKNEDKFEINLDIKLFENKDEDEDEDEDEDYIQTMIIKKDIYLNLGWLYLKNKEQLNPLRDDTDLKKLKINDEILSRLVLVSDKLFSQIVNDNLEVRTSNAIDPATGTAEDKALYSYEAIPRTTIMWFDVVYNKPEYFKVPTLENKKLEQKDISHGKSPGEGWTWLQENVEKGLSYFEFLGVGGMGTRGMGRIRILNINEPNPVSSSTTNNQDNKNPI